MTEHESPSALLERAATLLESRAAEASDAPWWIEWSTSDWRDTTPSKVFGRGKPLFEATSDARVADLEWIAMAHPGWASPLVEWLRAVASYVGDGQRLNDADRAALRFARRILGES